MKRFTRHLLCEEKEKGYLATLNKGAGFTHAPFPGNSKKGAGFTLIELIIYMAIAGLVLALISNFAFNIIEGSNISSVYREVQQGGRQTLATINRNIKNAAAINSLAPTSISLAMNDYAIDPTIIALNGAKIEITQGLNGPYDLTNDDVEVLSLLFTDLSYPAVPLDNPPDTPGTIKTELVLKHVNWGQKSAYEASFGFESTSSLRQAQISAPETIVLRPNAVGSESSLRINGCAENWQCVDEEISDDDTSYVYAMRSESSNDLYSLPDPGIDAASTIIQLRLYFNCRRNDIASKTVAGYLRTNSQSDQRPDKPLTDTYQIFSEVYPVNPVTANAWTSAEIDDLEIGINLTSTGGVPNEARCSQVWAEVEYVPF